MKVGQEVHIYQWDSATGDVFTSVDYGLDMDGLERAVITHIGDHTKDGNPLCWVEWVDRPMIHQANGAYRPASQLFLEVL
jgi:hypothetical protein